LLNRGKTSGRVDDKIEVIKKRFHTYNKETQPVIDYFSKQNKALIINAEQSV
jgi:adenylate kinase family enzyme